MTMGPNTLFLTCCATQQAVLIALPCLGFVLVRVLRDGQSSAAALPAHPVSRDSYAEAALRDTPLNTALRAHPLGWDSSGEAAPSSFSTPRNATHMPQRSGPAGQQATPHCGSCEAEWFGNTLWWSDAPIGPWAKPENVSAWELRQWSLFAPEEYPRYMEARASCQWVSTGSVKEHNDMYAKLRHGFPFPYSAGGDRFLGSPAHVCTLPPTVGADGTWTQTYITRIGPLWCTKKGYYHMGYKLDGFLTDDQFTVVPAAPAGDTAVVESIDSVTDEQGNAIQYPPLHTHHAASNMAGNWSYSKHFREDYVKAVFGPAMARTSFRFADFTECVNNESDTNACAYLKLPRSHAFVINDLSYIFAIGLYNIVDETIWTDKNVFFEFGRKYIVSSPTDRAHDAVVTGKVPNDRRNMWVWDFGVVSGGRYLIPHISRPFGSVAWRVFTLPFAIRVMGSWFHTHAAVASELFIIEGDVQKVLPSQLVSQCYSQRTCRSEGAGGDGSAWTDMALSEDMSTHFLRTLVTRGLNTGQATLRCQFKSRNELVNGKYYSRAHYKARALADECEDWTLKKDDKLSMLVFTYPLAPGRTDISPTKLFGNHYRWYAGVELLD